MRFLSLSIVLDENTTLDVSIFENHFFEPGKDGWLASRTTGAKLATSRCELYLL